MSNQTFLFEKDEKLSLDITNRDITITLIIKKYMGRVLQLKQHYKYILIMSFESKESAFMLDRLCYNGL